MTVTRDYEDLDDTDSYLDFIQHWPERMLCPANDCATTTGPALQDDRWRECRIWEGYFAASRLLLDRILVEPRHVQGLIFPALFNLRHAIEVALKWHIEWAGGAVPRNTHHDLDMLVETFRAGAASLDEDASYVCDDTLALIAELASVDSRGIAFRYAKERNGAQIHIAEQPWDLRALRRAAEAISFYFDNLAGWIEISTPEYQAALRELEAKNAAVTPTRSSPVASTYNRTSRG